MALAPCVPVVAGLRHDVGDLQIVRANISSEVERRSHEITRQRPSSISALCVNVALIETAPYSSSLLHA
jgi:hypothetical protein